MEWGLNESNSTKKENVVWTNAIEHKQRKERKKMKAKGKTVLAMAAIATLLASCGNDTITTKTIDENGSETVIQTEGGTFHAHIAFNSDYFKGMDIEIARLEFPEGGVALLRLADGRRIYTDIANVLVYNGDECPLWNVVAHVDPETGTII